MTMDMVRALAIVLVFILIGAFITGYLKSVFAKPVRGTLHVPQGKNRVPIDVFDDSPLRPFKYGQVFDTTFDPTKRTLKNAETGEVRTSTGAILFHGKPLGFVDTSRGFTLALQQLSEKHQQLIVPAVVSKLSAHGRPTIELVLPDTKWFSRALSERRRTI